MSFVAPIVLGVTSALGTGGIPLGGFAASAGIVSGLNTVGTVLSAVGTVATVAGAISGGQQQQAAAQHQTQAAVATQQNIAAAADFNAQVSRDNAAQAREVAALEVAEIRADTRRRTASIRARLAAGGVVTTAGSPLLATQAQVFEGARDVQKRLYRGELQATGFETQAIQDTFKSDVARSNVGIEQQAGQLRQQTARTGTITSLARVGANLAGTSIL